MNAAAVIDNLIAEGFMQQFMINQELDHVNGRVLTVEQPVDRQRVGRVVVLAHDRFTRSSGPFHLWCGELSAEAGSVDAIKEFFEVKGIFSSGWAHELIRFLKDPRLIAESVSIQIQVDFKTALIFDAPIHERTE